MKRLKKLNNRGVSTVEVLVSFILLVIVVVSMYDTVTTYKNKQSIEGFNEQITTYKNLLTKDIQDDLIKKGLVDARVEVSNDNNGNNDSYNGGETIYKVTMSFRDGSSSLLVVDRKRAFECEEKTTSGPCSEQYDDNFMIKYGPLKNCNGSSCNEEDVMEYPLPNLGYGEDISTGSKIYDLRINNVNISTKNNILKIYIDFYHPDLGTRYAMNIVCPINYF